VRKRVPTASINPYISTGNVKPNHADKM